MCNKVMYNITTFIYKYIPVLNNKFQQCKDCSYFCTNLIPCLINILNYQSKKTKQNKTNKTKCG